MRKILRFFVLCSMCSVLMFGIVAEASAEESLVEVETVTLQHIHTGSSTSGGGCYTKYVHSDGCGQLLTYLQPDYNADSYGTWGLYRCSAGHYQSRSVLNASGLHCQDGKFTRYDPECGLEEGAALGTIIVSRLVDDGYYLIPSAVDLADSVTNVSYEWSTGENGNCTVTGNGTYILTIRYTESGTEKSNQISHEVSDYDTTAPVISGVQKNTEAETNQDVILTVSADDNGGSGVAAYRIGDGDWQESNQLTVTDNDDYIIYAKDRQGNVSDGFPVSVKNIDKTAPTVALAINGGWSNGNVLLTATADDQITQYSAASVSGGDADIIEIGGLAPEAYSWDGGVTWTSSNTLSVSTNGTYSVVVRDKAGNTAYADISVECIDMTSPTVNLYASTTAWTNETVEISAVASDGQSGLAPDAYTWDGGATWTSCCTRTVSTNGTYGVVVRDNAGNTATAEIVVSNIDTTAPVIEIHKSSLEWYWELESVQITVTATDDQAGLAAEAYSWDGGVTWTSSSSYEVTSSGKILLKVRDLLGNEAVQEIEMIRQEKPKPIVQITPVEPSEPDPVPAPEPEPETEPDPEPKKNPAEMVQTPKPESEPEPEPDPEPKQVEIPENKVPFATPAIVAAGAGAAGTSTGGMIFFVFFWFFRKCKIFNDTGKQVGKARIKKKKGIYGIKIPEQTLKEGMQKGKLILMLGKKFVAANRGKTLEIYGLDACIQKNITEKIELNLRGYSVERRRKA